MGEVGGMEGGMIGGQVEAVEEGEVMLRRD